MHPVPYAVKPELVVIDPGPFATIQDLGRRGFQRYGVSGSGAMDEFSLRLANMLVGNSAEDATIEFTFSGGTWTVDADCCRIAIVGDFPIRVDDAAVPAFASHTLRRGARVTIGRAAAGMRGYLAVAGGFDIVPVLGSRSTDVRAGFGGFRGGALRAGTRLPLCSAAIEGPDLALNPIHLPKPGETLRIVFGPQEDYFDLAAQQTLLESAYQVTVQSDRMGCRIEGPPIMHSGGFNIISDGIVMGSIQVPGSGQPIILMADRQPTGGYPKIATVVSADLPVLAQKRPGDLIRFAAVSQEEAETLRTDAWNAICRLGELLLPTASGSTGLSSERLLSVNLISGVVGHDCHDERRW